MLLTTYFPYCFFFAGEGPNGPLKAATSPNAEISWVLIALALVCSLWFFGSILDLKYSVLSSTIIVSDFSSSGYNTWQNGLHIGIAMSSEVTYLSKADFNRKFDEVDGTAMAVEVSGFQVICSYIGLNL